MNFAARIAARWAAVVTTTGVIATVGLIAAPQSDSSGTYRVTSQIGLNVRSGPSTKHSIIGAIGRNVRVTTTGPARAGWAPVNYRGRTGWVAARYLTPGGAAAPAPPGGATAGSATTTAPLNARTGASTKYRSVVVLGKGTKVTLTGRTSGVWRQINRSGRLLWVHSAYLSTGSSTPTKPTTKGRHSGVATAALNLRSSSASNHRVVGELPKGTRLSLTGVVKNNLAQIVRNNKTYWVTARYVATTNPTAPSLPKVTGTRYATAALDIRSSAVNSFTLLEVPRGTALQVTGVQQNGRAQVIYQNAVRWVTAKYLSTSAPSSAGDYSKGLEGLRPSAKRIVDVGRQRFPQVKTYYGVRPDPLPDHPSGRAVDMMIPSYRSSSGQALGQAIANYLKANASSLNIEYIIWNQRIWSVARSNEGWRFMANRGSDTANHKDHVHVTVRN